MGSRSFKGPKVRNMLNTIATPKAMKRRLRKPETPAAPKPSNPAKELKRSTSLGMGLK